MKRNLLLIILVLSCAKGFGQKHEAGINAGVISVNPKRQQVTDMVFGYQLGGYYQYSPFRYAGVQAGVQYRRVNMNFTLTMPMYTGVPDLKHQLLLPMEVILFPHACFSWLAGGYFEYLFGKVQETPGFQSYKHPVFGVTGGARCNFKHFRLRVDLKRDVNAWITGLMEGKSLALNLSIEVPLWRR
jgi:hypothetical protein